MTIVSSSRRISGSCRSSSSSDCAAGLLGVREPHESRRRPKRVSRPRSRHQSCLFVVSSAAWGFCGVGAEGTGSFVVFAAAGRYRRRCHHLVPPLARPAPERASAPRRCIPRRVRPLRRSRLARRSLPASRHAPRPAPRPARGPSCVSNAGDPGDARPGALRRRPRGRRPEPPALGGPPAGVAGRRRQSPRFLR